MPDLPHNPSAQRSCLAIVLAAGEGTRMRSSRPKVLHEIAGRSMLAHVLLAVEEAGGTRTAVVIGPDGERVVFDAGHQPVQPIARRAQGVGPLH